MHADTSAVVLEYNPWGPGNRGAILLTRSVGMPEVDLARAVAQQPSTEQQQFSDYGYGYIANEFVHQQQTYYPATEVG